MKPGCYTALITPFSDSGDEVDRRGIQKLVDFQTSQGIDGILAVGTTGESPVLTWDEHHAVMETIIAEAKGKCLRLAGTGSNNYKEAMAASEHAAKTGADGILMVDPYYNGPSSLEIRREYISPIARALPDVWVIPYVIPGRTGAQLFPEDLAMLNDAFENLNSVKEATCDPENMKKTRSLCGPDFVIMSGDDPMTFEMMADPEIKAGGAISVTSNIAPAACAEMVRLLNAGETEKARSLNEALSPLFSIVTVKTREKTPFGEVECRARNPLAFKTAMRILGMPCGPCRQPLGKMTRKGLETVIGALKTVQAKNPEIIMPVSEFFGVDIDARLEDLSVLEGLCYDEY
ncbi:4-hydroxy-tetrahydrodipicolinate synthase [Candidatus Desulfarcum epimagneticum]|uniref:4-hydroxy-tetrahydrodipicolinate synthase n=1 Tax=uncultured Desulfobacteraceae bacterium TaxID=218296 RepID=A0A484HMG4_9BACT|nr:4-hydroxy-tetrahydrodipicolinate synthase [uncultured Desulfobacteraceae bacterium]